MSIVNLDPAIGSTNLGDKIISEAVNEQLKAFFPGHRIINISSRDVGKWSRMILKEADYIFLGGSNALSSNPIFGYRQFSMGKLSAISLSNIILFGVGWWQYQNGFGLFAKEFYRRLLRSDFCHSVRDEYTKNMLKSIGVSNVVNTGCPTMWHLNSFATRIPKTVVFTLTDYNPNRARDQKLIKSVLDKFDNILFWPQGTGDMVYLESYKKEFDTSRITIIDPSLKSFDDCLAEGSCYVGTRLHAGIRALQYNKPAFIVPIDNRAIEISKTESLPLVGPDLSGISMGDEYVFSRTHRTDAIQSFRMQFKNVK